MSQIKDEVMDLMDRLQLAAQMDVEDVGRQQPAVHKLRALDGIQHVRGLWLLVGSQGALGGAKHVIGAQPSIGSRKRAPRPEWHPAHAQPPALWPRTQQLPGCARHLAGHWLSACWPPGR